MVWRPTGVKPLPEPMLAHLTGAYMLHRGRWVNILSHSRLGTHISSLAQVLACHWFISKPLSEPTLIHMYSHWDPRKFIEIRLKLRMCKRILKCQLQNVAILSMGEFVVSSNTGLKYHSLKIDRRQTFFFSKFSIFGQTIFCISLTISHLRQTTLVQLNWCKKIIRPNIEKNNKMPWRKQVPICGLSL